MTNNEINKLLSMLDTKDLGYIKKYLLSEKDKLRQTAFENYMCNQGVKFNQFGDNHGTIIYFGSNEIIFSNRYSMYLVSDKVFNLKSAKLIRSMSGSNVRCQHRITEVDESKINMINDRIKCLSGNLKQVELLPKATKIGGIPTLNYSVLDEYAHLRDDIDDYVGFDFSKKEVEYANKILDNPKFKMDLFNPVLYGESEIGKVYILGFKKK